MTHGSIAIIIYLMGLIVNFYKTSGLIIKKTQKTPKNEIEKALTYKNEYLNNGGWKR